jgi:sporulation protein YlmC with PRC-barrel domain
MRTEILRPFRREKSEQVILIVKEFTPMKKVTVLIAVLFLFSLILTAQSFAAQAGEGKMGHKDAMKVSKLMDKEVQTQAGEELGKVKDVVIDRQGQAAFLIIEGEQDKLYPIPITAFRHDAQEDKLTTQISKDQLRNAPSFAEGEWPEFGQQDYQSRVYGYYGEQLPGHSTMPGMQRGVQPGVQTGTETERTHQPGTTGQPK